ncbi:hypothetical protein KCV03_g5241, partial [Aureobasidium melanogenum]
MSALDESKSSAAMSEFSQIACEICRTKKRKCDRKIPTCSQCIHTSQTCTYPGTSKRGLPTGYIASIEERLAQTEAALLQALSTIHGSQVPESRLPPAATEKARDMEYNEVRIAKVEEWQKCPLDTQEHQRDWMRTPVNLVTSGIYKDITSLAQHGNDRGPHMSRKGTDTFWKATGKGLNQKDRRSQDYELRKEKASGRRIRLKAGFLILIMDPLIRHPGHETLQVDSQNRMVPFIRPLSPYQTILMVWKHFLAWTKPPAKPRDLAPCTHGSTSDPLP